MCENAMDKSSRLSKIRARLLAAEQALAKSEAAFESATDLRGKRFGDEEMMQNAKAAAEGLNLACLDELRSMKMQPPPVVEIVARCVCTLASGDDLGDAEYRAAQKAKEAANAKKVAAAIARGETPPKIREPERRRLLSWEESQRVLSRSNFKDKIANFDGRVLLDNEDLVAEVRNRLDLASIKPDESMSANLKAPSLTKKEKADALAAAQRRREGYAYAIQTGDANAAPLVSLNDARYVSKIAPPLLVWIARVLSQNELLEPAWAQVTVACRDAAKKRDEAKVQVVILRKKMEETREDEMRKRQKAKEEKERAEALGLQLEEETEKAKKAAESTDKPTELTTPDRITISGPTPNVFFQNGRLSGVAGPGASRDGQVSPRLQMPPVIRFFIRVKHCRVSWPFPPSINVEKYLLTAQVMPGHEAAGPVAHVQFDPAHVIGLLEHQLLSFVQLVIEVPSTDTINPGIHPARLSFHPRHGSQLHSSGQGGAGTIEMPRLIVTIYPHLLSRHRSADRSSNSTVSLSHSSSSVNMSPASPMKPLTPVTPGSSSSISAIGGFTTPEGVPGLPIDMLRSIGSAYRNASSRSPSKARGTPDKKDLGQKIWATGKSTFGNNENWSRAAVALTERARTRPFALCKPGAARPIPDILLQNSKVAIDSAKRLSRSSARCGVETLKDLSKIVLRVTEGYSLTPSERSMLKKAADLEATVEREEREAEERALEEAANPQDRESGIAAAIKRAEEQAALMKAKADAAAAEAAAAARALDVIGDKKQDEKAASSAMTSTAKASLGTPVASTPLTPPPALSTAPSSAAPATVAPAAAPRQPSAVATPSASSAAGSGAPAAAFAKAPSAAPSAAPTKAPAAAPAAPPPIDTVAATAAAAATPQKKTASPRGPKKGTTSGSKKSQSPRTPKSPAKDGPPTKVVNSEHKASGKKADTGKSSK